MPISNIVKKIQMPIALLISAGIAGLAGIFYSPLAFISVALIALAVGTLLAFAARIAKSEKEHLEIHKILHETSSFESLSTKTSDISDLEITETRLGTDSDTGFITYPVFSAILEAKIATARRRLWPVTIVQLQINFEDQSEPLSADTIASIINFSTVVRQTLREADVVSRIGRRRFGIVLEDTDEEGGAWVAERIQVAQFKAGGTAIKKISAGVAGYPTNGASSNELMTRSSLALENAIANKDELGIGRVVVAPTVPYGA